MRLNKVGAAAAAVGLLATPAIGLAAGTVHPANGNFTGTASYKVSGKKYKGKMTIVVAKHKIASVQLLAAPAPVNKKHSHGVTCGEVSNFTTAGDKVKGSVKPSGKFSYTFSQSFKTGGKLIGTDSIKLKGRFTDSKHAKGTFLDVSTTTAASGPGASHCETGTLPFTATHS